MVLLRLIGLIINLYIVPSTNRYSNDVKQKMNEVQKKSVRRWPILETNIIIYKCCLYNDNFTVKQSCEAELVISLIFLLTKISYYNYDLIQIKLLFDSDSSLYLLKSSKQCIMAQKN